MTLGRQGTASPRLRIRKRRTRDTALRRPRRPRLLPRNACPQDAKCAARRLHVSDRSTGIRSEGVRKESFSTRKETLELRRDRRARLEEITMGALTGPAAPHPTERSGASPCTGSASLRPAEIEGNIRWGKPYSVCVRRESNSARHVSLKSRIISSEPSLMV